MANVLHFPTPNYRLITILSEFTNPKSNHNSIISQHWFNRQVEVVIPRSVKSVTLNKQVELESNAPAFYYEVETPLTQFLNPDFITNYVKKGDLYVISHLAQIDHTSSFAITPTGRFHLTVEKDFYQQLGIEGKPIRFSLPQHKDFYEIQIDLKSPSFVPGKKLYERVKWALDRTNPVSCLCCFVKDGIYQEIELPSAISVQKIQSKPISRRMIDIKAPEIDFALLFKALTEEKNATQQQTPKSIFSHTKVDNVHNNNSNPTKDESSSSDDDEVDIDESNAFLEDLYEWVGVISTRTSSAFSDETQPAISRFQFSLPFLSNVKECITLKHEGLIPTSHISSYLDLARRMINEKGVPYAVVNVWGFSDSPISWGSNQHSVVMSGENDYTFIVLPDNKYILYTALSTYDTYS